MLDGRVVVIDGGLRDIPHTDLTELFKVYFLTNFRDSLVTLTLMTLINGSHLSTNIGNIKVQGLPKTVLLQAKFTSPSHSIVTTAEADPCGTSTS